MKAITFIGMPGSGKSTIGKLLADRLQWNFIDLDLLIKEKTGKAHDQILEEAGEKELLRLEEFYTLGLNFNRLIFSPGGSIIYSPAAMEKLKRETAIFYLALPLEEIKIRLGDELYDRGIVGLKEKGIEGLFKERAPAYRACAHHTLNCQGFSEEKIIESIQQLIL